VPVEPPQSMSVSSPFFTPSVGEGAAHFPSVHTPLSQSDASLHPSPGGLVPFGGVCPGGGGDLPGVPPLTSGVPAGAASSDALEEHPTTQTTKSRTDDRRILVRSSSHARDRAQLVRERSRRTMRQRVC